EAQRARQEVDRQVAARAGLEQVLHLFVGLAGAELRVDVDDLEFGGAEAEAAGQLTGDDLGDQDPGALTRLPELDHVRAEVVALDHPGQRPALAQRRHVTRRHDLFQHVRNLSRAGERGLPPFARGLLPSARGLPPSACGLLPSARGLPPSACGLLPSARGLPPSARGLPLSAALGRLPSSGAGAGSCPRECWVRPAACAWPPPSEALGAVLPPLGALGAGSCPRECWVRPLALALLGAGADRKAVQVADDAAARSDSDPVG